MTLFLRLEIILNRKTPVSLKITAYFVALTKTQEVSTCFKYK